MKTINESTIIKNEEIYAGIYEMLLCAPDIVKEARAGQFVNLYTGQGDLLLPRPISICEINKEKNHIRLLYQTVGRGTLVISTFIAGDSITVLGPLGNGFSIPVTENKNVIIGGGIGVPPLLELVKNLKGENYVFIGAKNRPILEEEFRRLGAHVYVATDDGSEGYHGNAVDLCQMKNLEGIGSVYACGPKPMLKAVSKWALRIGVDPQISMEERMACGIGACVGCTTKIRDNKTGNWSHLKVCKDGPVFLGSEVIFGE